MNSLNLPGLLKLFHRNLKMPPLSICIREKETGNIVIATEVSLFSWLPGKCLPIYYSTIFSLIQSMAYCQKVSVAFQKVTVKLTWYLEPKSSKKNAKNRIRISIPLWLIWQRLLTLSVMMVSGKSCQSLAVHLSSSAWYVHSYDGMLAWVLNDGQSSDAFPVTNGVKQGCVLAHTLFSILVTIMLSDAFSDDVDSIKLSFHSDGNLFNLRRLQAWTKVKITSACDLLLADDCSLNAISEAGPQQSMNKYSSVQCIWPDHQYTKDAGYVQAGTSNNAALPQDHSEGKCPGGSGQVYLPQKCPLSECDNRWWSE